MAEATDKSNVERSLTEEQSRKLENDKVVLSDFKQNKLEFEAKKNWDLFYKRNTTKFFKDRHWTTREFYELCEKSDSVGKVLLEVGCGVGNFIFPLLQDDASIYVYACDFSLRAVNFVKENALYDESRCKAFVCDLTQDDLSQSMDHAGADVASMIFVLSAIHPDKMIAALKNVYNVLKPGGILLFRDYGLYDHAQLRFSAGHKLSDNFYVRQDGTRAYYFSKDKIGNLFEAAGFELVSNEYVLRKTVNHKEGLCVQRVFVQCKYKKPKSPQKCEDKAEVKTNCTDKQTGFTQMSSNLDSANVVDYSNKHESKDVQTISEER